MQELLLESTRGRARRYHQPRMATRRKPGRPHLDPDDSSVQMKLTLPTKMFDRLCRRALRHGESVAEIIRADLRRVQPPALKGPKIASK